MKAADDRVGQIALRPKRGNYDDYDDDESTMMVMIMMMMMMMPTSLLNVVTVHDCFQDSNRHIYRTSSSAVAKRPRDACMVSSNILLSHSRSLEVIRNDTVEEGVCKSLLVFH